MKTEEEKDEQLIRWLEGELSGSELSAFEASEAFGDYEKIIQATKGISFPQMNEKKVYAKIQDNISNGKSTPAKKTKVIPLGRWTMAAAAIVMLALAVMTILPSEVNVTSGIGQFVSHTLPDGSEIELNANSQIDYKDNFEKNRSLHLNGEA